MHSFITARAQAPTLRWMVCLLLVPLLLLSGMSLDIYVTHAPGSEAEHTHFSRVLGAMVARDHSHNHDDHDHGPASSVGPRVEPCCCAAEPESTVIVRNAGQATREGRDFAKQLDDQLSIVCFTHEMPFVLPEAVAVDRDCLLISDPASSQVLRSTVLLI